ncbi:MAG: FxLYD domain-containing protein [Vicinamibacterales bacterium]
MDAVLLTVTIVSLGVALVMSLVAWRVVRGERTRSAARVAALAADVAPPAPAKPARPAARSASPPARAPWAPAPAPVLDLPATRARPQAAGATARTARPPRELYLQPGTENNELPLNVGTRPGRSGAMPEGFLSAPPQGARRQRGLAVAAAVLMIALVGLGASMIAGPSSSATEVIPLSDRPPLELMSLGHDQADGTLAISGLVRNPSPGKPLDQLDAVVFLFDQDGTFVKSAVAPVDFRHLAPGDESPFVVRIDAPGRVARYRVSFRTPAGVVAHVDRR